MKIFFLTNTTDPTAGGWGRYTHDLIKELRKNGHTVRSTSETGAAERTIMLQSAWQHLSNPLSLFLDAIRVRSSLRTYNPDVLHITVETCALFLPLLLVPRRTRVVLTVHGTYAYPPFLAGRASRPFYRVLFRCAIKRIDAIIAVSNFTADRLKQYLHDEAIVFDTERIHVIHNGITVPDYKESSAARDTKSGKIILTVAPVKGRKGITESLRAVAAYRNQCHANISYRIVGTCDDSSSYVKYIHSLIKELELESVVTFVGHVSDKELQTEYARADLFLLLPVIKGAGNLHFEGFGLVYLEANARGIPAIGSKEGGSAEAIANGRSGFVANAHDPEEVAKRMRDILNLRLINPLDAFTWAQEHDIGVIVRQVVSVYQQAAQARVS